MIAVLLLCALVGAQSQTPVFSTLEGKAGDVTGTAAPSAVTVLLPSQVSAIPFSGTISMVGINLASTLQYGLAPAGLTCANGIDTTAGATGVAPGSTTTNQQIVVPLNWRAVSIELEPTARQLCYSTGGGWMYTGFLIGVVWNCQKNSDCSNIYIPTTLTAQQTALRQLQTTCCVNNPAIAGTANVGQCVNPSVQGCCGATAFEIATERCCNAANQVTATYEGHCPCTAPTVVGGSTGCPAAETCCLFTKYRELSTVMTSGNCFNPTIERCCNTGEIYDPGAQQCCSINGLQSLNLPCPCGIDSDCNGGQDNGPTGFKCCSQIWPTPIEITSCSPYSSYPDATSSFPEPLGDSPAQIQRCLGNCYSPAYQTCCNGVTCIANFDRCCNSTCCNRFTGTCVDAIHPGTPGNKFNPNEWNMHYAQCSVIEQLSPNKSFWIFVLPTYLLILTVASLALVLVFANKASTRTFNFIERAMIALSIFITIFAAALFFAPVYKYGVVLIFLAIFTIITAAARLKWLNIVVVIGYVVALLYLFDPFNGNAYFNFASNRLQNGAVDIYTAGVLHATWKMYHDRDSVATVKYCSNYYDYFNLDPAMKDYDRYDNPLVTTFGYCSRGWVTALLVFEGINLILTLVTFVIVLMALILRLKEDHGYDPIELEVRGQGTVTALPDLGYGY